MSRPRLGGLVPFPPGARFLLLPTSSRQAFRTGLTMWAVCRPMGRVFAAAVGRGVALVGTTPLRLLGLTDWRPPLSAEAWEEAASVWRGWFGEFDTVAIYRPRQSERSGMALLLLRDGTGVGFVKLRPGVHFDEEAAVLEALAGSVAFRAPEVKGRDTVDGWGMFGLSVVGGMTMSPRLRRSPDDVVAEVAMRLTGVSLPPGGPTPPHWVPMHGDMGPWNLRQGRGGRVLYDWEHCRLAPPGADLVFHAAACAAMRIRGAAEVTAYDEAIEYWTNEIPERFGSGSTDQKLARQMLAALAAWS